MKILVCLTLFLSFSANAQVKTGGFVSPEDSSGSSSAIVSFETQLIASLIQCKDKGQEGLQLGKDLPTIYSQLSVIKNLEVMRGACEKRNAYFKCLASVDFKKAVAKMEKDPESAKTLQSKYNFSAKEVKNFYAFFKTIDKICEDPCK